MSNRTQHDDEDTADGEAPVTRAGQSRSEIIDRWSRNTSIATSDHLGAFQWARLLSMPADSNTPK